MRNKNEVKGYVKGLEEIGAKPATGAHGNIYSRVYSMSEKHGEQVSAGGNAEKLHAIALEKIAMHKDEVRKINSDMAKSAAYRLANVSKSIRDRYESNPTKKLADIMDAQARIGALTKGQATAVADEIMKGTRDAQNEYELLAITKMLPKHEITQAYQDKDDFAFWTPEGKAAFNEMQTYAKMGDRLPFNTADGEMIGAKLDDLYSPPEYSAREVAEREMDGQIR